MYTCSKPTYNHCSFQILKNINPRYLTVFDLGCHRKYTVIKMGTMTGGRLTKGPVFVAHSTDLFLFICTHIGDVHITWTNFFIVFKKKLDIFLPNIALKCLIYKLNSSQLYTILF